MQVFYPFSLLCIMAMCSVSKQQAPIKSVVTECRSLKNSTTPNGEHPYKKCKDGQCYYFQNYKGEVDAGCATADMCAEPCSVSNLADKDPNWEQSPNCDNKAVGGANKTRKPLDDFKYVRGGGGGFCCSHEDRCNDIGVNCYETNEKGEALNRPRNRFFDKDGERLRVCISSTKKEPVDPIKPRYKYTIVQGFATECPKTVPLHERKEIDESTTLYCCDGGPAHAVYWKNEWGSKPKSTGNNDPLRCNWSDAWAIAPNIRLIIGLLTILAHVTANF